MTYRKCVTWVLNINLKMSLHKLSFTSLREGIDISRPTDLVRNITLKRFGNGLMQNSNFHINFQISKLSM